MLGDLSKYKDFCFIERAVLIGTMNIPQTVCLGDHDFISGRRLHIDNVACLASFLKCTGRFFTRNKATGRWNAKDKAERSYT